MDDLFYFTKSDIELSDIAIQAGECGLSYEYIDTNRYLRVFNGEMNEYGDAKDYSDWRKIEKGDGVVFEDEPLEKIAAFQPATAFIITFHIYSLALLTKFLKHVLLTYDGWIGCDDDFETTYNVENIESIKRR